MYVLWGILAIFGLRAELVRYNRISSILDEFQEFLKWNEIKYKINPPHHPSLNNEAERYVQTGKNCLKNIDKRCIKSFQIPYGTRKNIA